MIQVEASGRVRLVEGPVHHLRVHGVLRVYAGNQNSPERNYLDPDGFVTYVLARGVTYNVLKPGVSGRTITDRRITSVMVDRQGACWSGEPTNWKPVRVADPTVWDRLLEAEDQE